MTQSFLFDTGSRILCVLSCNCTHNMYFNAHNLFVSASVGDLFGQLMREDPSTIKGAEILMLGEMLTLPQNFG